MSATIGENAATEWLMALEIAVWKPTTHWYVPRTARHNAGVVRLCFWLVSARRDRWEPWPNQTLYKQTNAILRNAKANQTCQKAISTDERKLKRRWGRKLIARSWVFLLIRHKMHSSPISPNASGIPLPSADVRTTFSNFRVDKPKTKLTYQQCLFCFRSPRMRWIAASCPMCLSCWQPVWTVKTEMTKHWRNKKLHLHILSEASPSSTDIYVNMRFVRRKNMSSHLTSKTLVSKPSNLSVWKNKINL